jgi:triosephosphate isomerase
MHTLKSRISRLLAGEDIFAVLCVENEEEERKAGRSDECTSSDLRLCSSKIKYFMLERQKISTRKVRVTLSSTKKISEKVSSD